MELSLIFAAGTQTLEAIPQTLEASDSQSLLQVTRPSNAMPQTLEASEAWAL